ncbi:MAG TPA: rhomboid family intramembrane serine protease [Gemmatimonadaceae bacterium]|nr:rhomboid family intramembrane serine protease [Gemmatimonadaceae bacterium]
MIPIRDENPHLRTPYMTYILLAAIVGTWVFVQGAGLDERSLITSICSLGMIPGELTAQVPVGYRLPIAEGVGCVIDDEPINWLTPITSMFLHGGWAHLLGNVLFFWVFANNIEDSMGRFRFLVFYLICGLAAAVAHVILSPASPIPTVGASGAISGVMGAYLVLYPRVRVHMLFIFIFLIRIIPLPAWVVLLWWFALQVLTGLPELAQVDRQLSGGVAVWAHVGGFLAGVILVKPFENEALVRERNSVRRALHPGHP